MNYVFPFHYAVKAFKVWRKYQMGILNYVKFE